MFKNFMEASGRLGGGGSVQKTEPTLSNEITESQAIYLRKAAAMAILEEYGRFQLEKGDTKIMILRKLEEQTMASVESLTLPSKMASEMVQSVMKRLYPAVSRKERVLSSMVGNITEINKEDPGGDDAGIGLPAELRAPVMQIKKFDKEIDESADLVVEKCGNKFIELSFKAMQKHLPKDFVIIMS